MPGSCSVYCRPRRTREGTMRSRTWILAAATASLLVISTRVPARVSALNTRASPVHASFGTSTSRTARKTTFVSVSPILNDISVASSPTAPAPLHPRLYEHQHDDDDALSFRNPRPGDDDPEDTSYGDAVDTYRTLMQSTGSEILPTDLQRQIELAPNVFLESHVQDASDLEKIAMRSITTQLPQAAMQAFMQSQSKQQQKFQYAAGQLNSAVGQRVTPEQEIQLARIIQQGAQLQGSRVELENQLGRSCTKQEWADKVGLSNKELRRVVNDYRRAKHDLVTANLGLVHAVVNQQYGSLKTHTGITKEELIQEGSLGLLRAAELFDPERGLRFSTYAVVWIKGVLSNSHLPELVRLPAREKTKWNKIQTIQRELETANGVVPTVEELATLTGMTVQEVVQTTRRMQQARSILSLDFEYSSHSRSGADTATSSAALANQECPEDAKLAARTQLQADVIAAMARNLDAREARLLRLRYGLADGQTRSLAECADAMGLSPTRTQQIAQTCLSKLRQAAEAESLEEYLLTIA